MRVSARRAGALLALLIVGAGALGVQPAAAADVTLPLLPVGDVGTWPGTPFRWKDIAWNLYAEEYRNTFTYDSPSVAVTYDDQDPVALRGQIVATGLKPNFAYQMKLVGKNSKVWGAEGDDASNEQLGFAGRWWRSEPSPGNTNDAEYLAWHTDPNYIFEGYLLFDFFITNELGSAVKDFSVDSSFHVLFTTDQRTPRGNDSVPVSHTVQSDGAHAAYDGPVGPTGVAVYAEWEPGRALPGTLVLPIGNYRVQLILTEESFHDSGLGGYWAAAMGVEELSFTLGSEDESCDGQGGDVDGDGVCGDSDNCSDDPNPGQEDMDGDGIGDACDPQTCGNGVLEDGEDCDDGNAEDGDCCSTLCQFETAICEDDDACTTNDLCLGGSCVGGPPPACDDDNFCTDDLCDPAVGCVNPLNTNLCDNGNPCTDDSCDPASGCVHSNNTAPCDDENACTTGDTCSGGACAGGAPVTCDDGNVCNGTETCHPQQGCEAGAPVECPPGETCDPSTGECVASACALAEDFNSYAAGEDPPNWVDTGPGNSMAEVDLHEVLEVGGERVFGTSSTLVNIHSHYVTPESATWSDYTLTGRFRFDHPNAGLGVTVASQYNSRDAYYRLRRYGGHPTLYFSSHGTAEPSGGCDTGVVSVANVWYRFQIEVQNTGAATALRAKVWEDGTPEPGAFQTSGCVDASPTRLTAGTVGVWSMSPGTKYWDDLAVGSAGECGTTPPPECGNEVVEPGEECDDGNTVGGDCCDASCLFENAGSPCGEPTSSVCTAPDTCDGAGNCQANHATDGLACDQGNACTVGGTCQGGLCTGGSVPDCTPLDDQCNTASCDPSGEVGNCDFRTPVANGTECEDGNVCNVGETCQSGNCTGGSAPDCSSSGDPCHVASCDPAGGNGNCDIVTPVLDGTGCDDGIVCTGGDQCTAGVCGGVPNDALCDDGDPCNGAETCSIGLGGCEAGAPVECPPGETCDPSTGECVASACALAEDFNSYAAGEDPPNWVDTGPGNSMAEVDLHEVLEVGGERVFGTSSTLVNIHSHYVTPESATWSDYTLTGRFRFDHPNAGLGVTIASQYNSRDAYYRLRRYGGHPTLYFSSHGTAEPSGGCDTGVVSVANVWYRFKIEVEDTGTATALRAKVWEGGTPEPGSFQTTGCVDASPTRLTAGTVGVWSMGSGTKYWDDLAVGSAGECF